MSEVFNKKKLTRIDEFARKYFCLHARRNLLRAEKQQAKVKFRRITKQIDSGHFLFGNDHD